MSLTIAPEQAPQHLSALARANYVRLGHADVKREIGTGELTVQEALDDERTESMPVVVLLLSQHRWGAIKARAVLRGLCIGELRKVRDLTDRQKTLIAAACRR